MVKKLSAADRTIGMFDQPVVPSTADAEPATRVAGETIETAAERWRTNAFATQTSKHFNDSVPGREVFRLTIKDGWRYLEQFRLDSAGGAYHYAGLMFRDENLNELAGLLVRAAKEKANG